LLLHNKKRHAPLPVSFSLNFLYNEKIVNPSFCAIFSRKNCLYQFPQEWYNYKSMGGDSLKQLFSMQAIAHIQSDFSSKFGIPRQSGLVDALESTIVFEPPFRNPDALRGLGDFSHIWLIWAFSESVQERWSPMVRPPRLGGNVRMGVFATRSPFRPNPIGLSSVRLERIELTEAAGPVLHVRGADLMNGTPIFDIKPYIPYSDCHPDALGGFAPAAPEEVLKVCIPPDLLEKVPAKRRKALLGILAQDPRPSYQKDPNRVYGFSFAGLEVQFQVTDPVLTVVGISASADAYPNNA